MELEIIQQELKILATNLELQAALINKMSQEYPKIMELMSRAKMIRWSEEELKALKSLLDDTKNQINQVWHRLEKLSDYFGYHLEHLYQQRIEIIRYIDQETLKKVQSQIAEEPTKSSDGKQ